MRVVDIVARRTAAALVLSTILVACGRSENQTTDSAAGNVGAAAATVDTGLSNAATPIAGGTAQITPTDAASVSDASEYRLTEDNFRRFLAASDSLATLRRRDPQVRALFDKQVSDDGTTTRATEVNAGRKRLEENPAVNAAIESAGMSAKDYFVAAIAIAQAERFMGNPNAAPPTPALPSNAEFLRSHQTELTKLRALERGGAAPVTATPAATPPAGGSSAPARP